MLLKRAGGGSGRLQQVVVGNTDISPSMLYGLCRRVSVAVQSFCIRHRCSHYFNVVQEYEFSGSNVVAPFRSASEEA